MCLPGKAKRTGTLRLYSSHCAFFLLSLANFLSPDCSSIGTPLTRVSSKYSNKDGTAQRKGAAFANAPPTGLVCNNVVRASSDGPDHRMISPA